MRISDWSSDVCSADLRDGVVVLVHRPLFRPAELRDLHAVTHAGPRLFVRLIRLRGADARRPSAHVRSTRRVDLLYLVAGVGALRRDAGLLRAVFHLYNPLSAPMSRDSAFDASTRSDESR